MNDCQTLYDIIWDFIEANPDIPLIEVMGVFEIVKLQFKDLIDQELNQNFNEEE